MAQKYMLQFVEDLTEVLCPVENYTLHRMIQQLADINTEFLKDILFI